MKFSFSIISMTAATSLDLNLAAVLKSIYTEKVMEASIVPIGI